MTERFPDEYFLRQDMSRDELFYTTGRKVVHIDDHAIAAVRHHLGDLLPPGGVYLDLMSSWRSHLPDDLSPARVAGLGMNADEMADNPQLTDYVVHNLNADPILPFDDAEFDGAFCTVSVQYLTRPIEVLRDVNRVLKPGAPFLMTFSNRCFPTKAVAIWLATTDRQHIALVSSYFEESGGWVDLQASITSTPGVDPLYAVWAKKGDA
jgi:SAM-dependent methyltransferase